MFCTDGVRCEIGCLDKRRCEGKDPKEFRVLGRARIEMERAKRCMGWDSMPYSLHERLDALFEALEP